MPIFEIETPEGTFEVDAPDEQTALQALKIAPQGDVPEFVPIGKDGQPLEGYNRETGMMDKPALNATGTFAAAGPEGVPIIGPLLDKGAMAASAGIGSAISGDPYSKVRSEMEAMKAAGNEAHPIARLGGNLTGALATLGPVGATEAGGWALGTRGASLGGRALRSGISGAGISAADTVARGGDGFDAIQSAGIGGALGGAIPVLGAGIRGGLGAAGGSISQLFNSARNPAAEAERRLGGALSRDARAGDIMTPVDEAAARAGNVPVINADRGGETTRALARSVGNQSPEARGMIERTASDRFASQGQRASNFIRRLTGSADDVQLQERIRTAAVGANRPAYRQAYQDGAELIKTPELERLMGSPAVVSAMKSAIKTGKDRAVREGMGTFSPAISVTDDGRIIFNKVNPAGGTTFPDLQFWDYTKRELDDIANAAARAGRNGEADTVRGLARSLREELDRMVPSYRGAREGAAAFFGAEDALEAGKKFANTPRLVPEARRAFQRFTAAERTAFGTGYASELIDRIGAAGDRTNVINSVFRNQAARESMEMVFGPARMRQLEAYVRVEDLVDRLRGAMGGSTTTRQLSELGIGAVGGGYYTGDLQGALIGAAVVGGPRFVRNRMEQNVMRQLGRLLTADDPALIQRLIHNAASSPRYMQALDRIGRNLQAPVRAGALSQTSPAANRQ